MMKQTFNFHTHTARCHHAVGSDEAYVQAAIAAGITELGFSDHMPLDEHVIEADRMKEVEFAGYLASLQSLKEKYADVIHIYIGLECEYYADRDSLYASFLKQVDYLILGQHYPCPNGEDYCFNGTDERTLQYGRQVIAGLNSGYFSYLAHPDYFMFVRDSFSEACVQTSYAMLKEAKRLQIPVEINLKGYRRKRQLIDGRLVPAYPNPRLFAIAAEIGNDVVFGLDCHDPRHFALFQQEIEQFQTEYADLGLHYLEAWRP